MILRAHKYNNAYTEEQLDNNGNVLSYKQWNDGVLIIDREWLYDSLNRQTCYHDKITKYLNNTFYTKFGNIEIKNDLDSDGRRNKFYSEQLSPLKYRTKFNYGEWEEKEITFN